MINYLTPPPVVPKLRGIGYRFTLDRDGTLRIHPDNLPPIYLRKIRQQKDEIVRYLDWERRSERETLANAERLGMIAKWSRGNLGFISILDPTTGEYHDLQVKDAPGWASREARERRDMWKHEGVKGTPTSRDMERRYQENRTPEPGIVDDLEAAT